MGGVRALVRAGLPLFQLVRFERPQLPQIERLRHTHTADSTPQLDSFNGVESKRFWPPHAIDAAFPTWAAVLTLDLCASRGANPTSPIQRALGATTTTSRGEIMRADRWAAESDSSERDATTDGAGDAATFACWEAARA